MQLWLAKCIQGITKDTRKMKKVEAASKRAGEGGNPEGGVKQQMLL